MVLNLIYQIYLPTKLTIFFRFGINQRPEPPRAKITESIAQALGNILWVAIGATALLSSIMSLIFGKFEDVWDGISIIIVAILLVVIIVATDYVKDKKYI